MQIECTPYMVGRPQGELLVSRLGVLGRGHEFMHEQERECLFAILKLFHEVEEDGKLG